MKPLPKQGPEPPSMRPRHQHQHHQQQHLSAASLKESEGVRNRGLVATTMSIVSASRHSSTSSSSERASSRDSHSHSHGSTAEGYSSCSEDGLETEDSPCQGSRSKKRSFSVATARPSSVTTSMAKARKHASHALPVVYRADGKKLVEKNSLTEEALVAAKIRAANTCKYKTFLSKDDKKEERRAANRLSAFQSRQRRKVAIEDLQKTVASLSKDYASQRVKVVSLCFYIA